ncbi:hypothetical protein ACEWY4_003184 [Coilia grayii]|uniref:Ig-like domain-containing protein n=1 Tax=Coilia grayii TaxID=363190 RepID=A0ABD1KQK5_9TELE
MLLFGQGIISSEIKLDQSPSEVKRPGETVKISCKISGYSMTRYNIHWIRQKPGEALEWIGEMSTGNNAASYAKSLKEQFTLTEDVPSSTQFLEAKSLRAEDTAVYYCAREPQSLTLVKQLYQNHQPKFQSHLEIIQKELNHTIVVLKTTMTFSFLIG